jgi:hypothetical protein
MLHLFPSFTDIHQWLDFAKVFQVTSVLRIVLNKKDLVTQNLYFEMHCVFQFHETQLRKH